MRAAGAVHRYLEVRVTTPDAASAHRIARLLVEERLAACVQVLPGVTSVYRWEGAVETAAEHLLLVKTDAGHFDDIRERVRAEHPYDTPEVLAVPVAAVDERYAAWLDDALATDDPEDDGDPPQAGG